MQEEVEDFGEDFMKLVEETVKELEKTDKEFKITHQNADTDMVDDLKESGAVKKF